MLIVWDLAKWYTLKCSNLQNLFPYKMRRLSDLRNTLFPELTLNLCFTVVTIMMVLYPIQLSKQNRKLL